MNTNTSTNPFQTTPLDKVVDTHAANTNTTSATDLDETKPTTTATTSSTKPTIPASENPFATPTSSVKAPATSTDSAIDTNNIPLISPSNDTTTTTTTTTTTNPSTHAPALSTFTPHDAGLPGKLAVEPEPTTTASSIPPSQGTYAPSGPVFDQDPVIPMHNAPSTRTEREVDASEVKVPSGGTALDTAKEVATLARDVALAANEQVQEKVVPVVASYLPSAETTKQVAASAGETAVATGAVVGQAAYNAGVTAVETAKPYMPTAEQTKDAAATAGSAALGATVVAGQAAASGAVAAGQTIASGAAVAGQSIAGGAAVAGQTVADGAAVAGQSALDAGSAAAETTRSTGAAVADSTTNAAVSTKEGVAYSAEHPISAVYNAAAAAGNVILSYIPLASTVTAPTTSLPSSETSQNTHPSTAGGVGTLPGPPGEFGVAILPDEKTGGINTSQAVSAAGVQPFSKEHKAEHLGGAGLLPGKAGEQGVTVLPEERNKSVLPSRDMALPQGEGVAVLPGEKGLPHPKLVQEVLGEDSTGPSIDKPMKTFGTTTGGVGDLPGTPNESSVALLPDEKLNPVQHSTTSSKPTGSSTTSSGPNVDGRSHPLTKAEEKVFGKHTDDEKAPAVPPKDDKDNSPTHTTEPQDQDVHRKPTLMDKVKGEAKVVTGKLTKNEEKVEDGKKLMGKAIN